VRSVKAKKILPIFVPVCKIKTKELRTKRGVVTRKTWRYSAKNNKTEALLDFAIVTIVRFRPESLESCYRYDDMKMACIYLLLSIVAVTRYAQASVCTGSTRNAQDTAALAAMVACSQSGQSLADWGKCMQCNGACELQQYTSTCLLGYSQVLSPESCTLSTSICQTPFGTLINATCTDASLSTLQCATFPIIPVAAGGGGGVLLICFLFIICRQCRNRSLQRTRARRRAERKMRTEIGDSSVSIIDEPKLLNLNLPWRPSLIMKSKGVVGGLAGHHSQRNLSAMSSSGAPSGPPPTMVSNGSFRGPPPQLVSNGSFRSPPPPPPMVSNGSFRGPPQMVSNGSFRGPPQMVSNGSFRGTPQLVSNGSFNGMPPAQMSPPNSFQTAQQLQSYNSFRSSGGFSASPQFYAPVAAPGMPQYQAPMQMPPGSPYQSQMQFQSGPGLAPLPPPSRPSSLSTNTFSPSSGSQAPSTQEGSAPAVASVPVQNQASTPAPENSLLAQLKAGKKSKLEEQAKQQEVKKSASGSLMGELSKKMRKKRGSVVE